MPCAYCEQMPKCKKLPISGVFCTLLIHTLFNQAPCKNNVFHSKMRSFDALED